eukprot:14549564-Alexandrium_andersonii.AAC.1
MGIRRRSGEGGLDADHRLEDASHPPRDSARTLRSRIAAGPVAVNAGLAGGPTRLDLSRLNQH